VNGIYGISRRFAAFTVPYGVILTVTGTGAERAMFSPPRRPRKIGDGNLCRATCPSSAERTAVVPDTTAGTAGRALNAHRLKPGSVVTTSSRTLPATRGERTPRRELASRLAPAAARTASTLCTAGHRGLAARRSA